jgi:hypothetical protein
VSDLGRYVEHREASDPEFKQLRRQALLDQLTHYWIAQVSEVKRSFLERHGVTVNRSWRASDYAQAIAALLISMSEEQRLAEAADLDARGIKWRRST